ncbi:MULTISPECIES: enterochelin esterase [Dickeya]|uniref:Chrysobactin oligopeptidase CbsH n=1 Tax=Dickeya aquatica TaxID=1401087 RepID=A0A375A8A1_9GAMM|nr:MULTISPECIES: enterochelin esterase [Dickeya]SLM62265.1 Chrysobactin oligopeptidase CbsH [Dickeya aquatica]
MSQSIERLAVLPSGFSAALLSSREAGSESWWQQLAGLGTPLVEALDEARVTATFFWRDPQGDEHHSTTVRVYADVNGVTDHHSLDPQSLERLAATDVWHWSVALERDWRGSYSLIPVSAAQCPPRFSADAQQCEQQQRAWWRSVSEAAIADPLNRYQPWGAQLSLAQMPNALPQHAWQVVDYGKASAPDVKRLTTFVWRSPRLGNQRRIWLYTTGDSREPAQRPLAILLDGQKWAVEKPVFAVLDAQTAAGALPPAVWLLIDAIDMPTRSRELPCCAEFWLALQQELLVQAAQITPFSEDPDRTVVAGQSYGGLAALYAGLHWPERFGRILTQSGSFWWPQVRFITDFDRRDTLEPGQLIHQVRQGGRTTTPLVIFQEAGRREADIAFVNQQMRQALSAAGHRLHWREYAGGHDTLCWRGGLIDGLSWLLNDPAILSHEVTTMNQEQP